METNYSPAQWIDIDFILSALTAHEANTGKPPSKIILPKPKGVKIMECEIEFHDMQIVVTADHSGHVLHHKVIK